LRAALKNIYIYDPEGIKLLKKILWQEDRVHAQASADCSVVTVNVCINLVAGAGFEPTTFGL
jgi:hypothetical protein